MNSPKLARFPIATAALVLLAGCHTSPASSIPSGQPVLMSDQPIETCRCGGCTPPKAAPVASVSTPAAAAESLKRLMDGNHRFVDGKVTHPDQSTDRRSELVAGQKPFAVILACADSRVAPELAFDAGLGDVFVIRVAGNIADDAVLASIEYAVEHLGAPLVVVMGHAKCGAVKATVDTVATGATPPGHLAALIEPIKPAVIRLSPGGDLVDRAVDANVRNVVTQLRGSRPLLGKLATEGKIKIVGGKYDLATGEFKLLDVPTVDLTGQTASLLHESK